MLEEALAIAVALAAGFVVEGICTLFENLWGRPSNTQVLPMSLTAELSDHDRDMADKTRSVIRECFYRNGNNVTDSIRQMDGKERLEAVQDFCSRLAAVNGLQIDNISFYRDRDIGNCGSYDFKTNSVKFNIEELMWDSNDSAFEDRITNFLDTIVHEYRHAVQMRAIREKGFWQVEDERRVAWANNLPPNYIHPRIDPRGYRMQPIESDAFTYAALVMEGVR